MSPNKTTSTIKRSTRYYIIWTVLCGVTLAFGGSVLEPFGIPLLNVSLASPFVAFMITINKIVVRRPLSVTFMYGVVSIIAIFTGYLGPPSPLKPIFILAGLSFDAATLFRTHKLKLWNLIIGHAVITITGFTAFWVIYSIHLPEAALTLQSILEKVAPFHFAVSVIVAVLVWFSLRPDTPPFYLRRAWDQLSDDEDDQE